MKNSISITYVLLMCIYSISNAIVWPLSSQNDSTHRLNKTYGDWNGLRTINPDGNFHTGIDLPANVGRPVLACINGHVSDIEPDTAGSGKEGYIIIKNSAMGFKGWHYGHIKPDTIRFKRRDTVKIGDTLGTVADFPIVPDHLHFVLCDSMYTEIKGYRNPLDDLLPVPAQESTAIKRVYGFSKRPYDIFYVKDKHDVIDGNSDSLTIKYAHDSLDIIVHAATTVNGDTNCGVYAIGFGIKPMNNGDSMTFRRMFIMRGQISEADTNKYKLAYMHINNASICGDFKNWYIVTNCCGADTPYTNSGLNNIEENCWPTKVNNAGTAKADSIEDAYFPDGHYITTIRASSHSGHSCVVEDTLLVDNFDPKIKSVFPVNGCQFVPTRQKTIFCILSEELDTATVKKTNIKVINLRDTTKSYTIDTLKYSNDTLLLQLRSEFKYKDSVQVRLYRGIHDLAGKSIDGSTDTVAYSWNFKIGTKQASTDGYNKNPSVYHGKVVWQQGNSINSKTGKIMMYDFYQDTTTTINSDTTCRNPMIYGNNIVYFKGSAYNTDTITQVNSVWLYNGAGNSTIATTDYCRALLKVGENGAVWYSLTSGIHVNDTTIMKVEYFNFNTNTLCSLDEFIAAGYGCIANCKCDIDEGKIVWNATKPQYSFIDSFNVDTSYSFRTIKLHDIATNQTDIIAEADTGRSNSYEVPALSQGYVVWQAYDTVNSVKIYNGDSIIAKDCQDTAFLYWQYMWPDIDNGHVAYPDNICFGTTSYLRYCDGFTDGDKPIASNEHAVLGSGFELVCEGINNRQVVYRWQNDSMHNISCYNSETDKTDTLIKDATKDVISAKIHDGFISFNMWDAANGPQIYMVLGDTLPWPKSPKNLHKYVATKNSKAAPTNITITWNKNTETPSYYNVYRSETPGQYGRSRYGYTVSGTDTMFTDVDPHIGLGYYVVTAVSNTGRESGFSKECGVKFGTVVGGMVFGTWAADSGPYRAATEIYVPTDSVLTIEPGVKLKFSTTGNHFNIYGKLVARGTESEHIVFTGTRAIIDSFDWQSIIFDSCQAGSILEYCDFYHGGQTEYTNGVVTFINSDTNANINYCTFHNSSRPAIYVYNSKTRITNCQIQDNISRYSHYYTLYGLRNYLNGGITWVGDSLGYISNCTITGNSGEPFWLPSGMLTRLDSLTISGNWLDTIYVAGDTIKENGQIHDYNVPYYQYDGDVTIDSGVVIALDPGVDLAFEPETRLNVLGTLTAQGTVSERISFNKVSFNTGTWGGIMFGDTLANGNLVNCDISNSNGPGVYAAAVSSLQITSCNIDSSSVGISIEDVDSGQVQSCNISNCDVGIAIYCSNVPFKVRNCVIQDNDTGAYINFTSAENNPDFGRSDDLGHNTFKDNAQWNIFNNSDSTYPVYAIGNYWGKTDSAAIDSTIYDYSDESTAKGEVNFMPFLQDNAVFLSDRYDATGMSNGRKLAYDSTNNVLHAVWYNNDGIYYSSSGDMGTSWANPEFVVEGSTPALGLDSTGNPCIAYATGNNIDFMHKASTWESAALIGTPAQRASGGGGGGGTTWINKAPSVAIGKDDTIFVAYLAESHNQSVTEYVVCARFNIEQGISEAIRDTLGQGGEPEIVSDPVSGNIFIAYRNSSFTYFQSRAIDGIWSDTVNLSYSEATQAHEPSINLYMGNIYVTWVEEGPSVMEVCRISKAIDDTIWPSAYDTCSNATANGTNVINASCASGIAVWTEKINDSLYTVKYRRPDASAISTVDSCKYYQAYPHAAIGNDSSVINILWTKTIEGEIGTGPYNSVISFKSISNQGSSSPHRKPDPIASATKFTFSLNQSYPNPMVGHTKISFSLPQSGKVRLNIYNIQGQLVKTLVNGSKPAGAYQVEWDGRDSGGRKVSSGVYIYRLQTNAHKDTKKMVVIR